MNALSDIDPEQVAVQSEFGHARPLTACHWDPSGRRIFFGAEDNGVHRYDLASQEVTTLRHHDSWVRAIAASPDGKTVVSGGYDGRLVWWPADAERPEPTRVVDDAHQGWIRGVAFSPDGRHLATCGNDRRVNLWDSLSGELVASDDGHDHHVYNLAFRPEGDRLYSCDLHGYVRRWDLAAWLPAADARQPPQVGPPAETLTRLEQLHRYDTTFRADIGGARCIAFSGDGERLAFGGITNVTNAFAGVGEAAAVLVELSSIGKPAGNSDEATGPDAKADGAGPEGDAAEPRVMTTQDKPRGTLWGIEQHATGFWIGVAGGGGGGWLYFWRDGETEEFFKFKLKSDGRGMSLSPDGQQVAVAHADRHLRIYRLSAATDDPPA